ncbi:MAG: DUF1573 domain-containing protein [Anaerolinea sp.]|nr:DUF1573 domain-containing protein [Anaerolinea sp.]
MGKGKLLLLLVIVGVMGLAACSSQPQITAATYNLALGNLVNGEIATRQVEIQNGGQADLVIEAVSTSCGCTEATLSPLTIAPGETGVLSVSFDSGAHGPALSGEIIRQVFVYSNDPKQPQLVVEVAATILLPAVP